MSIWLRAAGLTAATVALTGCSIGFGGGDPEVRTVTETVIQIQRELCPVEITEPACPDFPALAERPWEVVLKERDVIYEACRGDIRVILRSREACEED